MRGSGQNFYTICHSSKLVVIGVLQIVEHIRSIVDIPQGGKKGSDSRYFCGRTAKAGSDVVQSRRPIFDDFSQHLWPYIGNNTVNVIFQMVKRLWLIRIDQ
ncbi:hypothetical protein TNCV_4729901 [Trichonephila clavipes]|nr:hypothetical protein TNCV_4729901 [Trichonephila clavipes]